MQRIAPEESAGFKRFDASIAPPDVAPAPITVWISSMNRIACGSFSSSLDDALEALLEIAAVAGAGEQSAHVERVDDRALEHVGNVALDDLAGEALGDGGFADPGVADIERVVLRPAAQNLDGAVNLRHSPDQRVDLNEKAPAPAASIR